MIRRLLIAAGILAAVMAAAVVAAAQTPIGGWAQSFFFGTGVSWAEAYSAFEAGDQKLPRDGKERERLLLAWAHVESEPPAGLGERPRLRDAGTLARLRYETFDSGGERLDQWDVRALVPALPKFTDVELPERFGSMACPSECRTELQRSDATLIARSGEPGIAAEWVLRMPVGETFDLGSRSLVTQDILAPDARSLPITFRREGGRDVRYPANIRVTLVEACAARVRVGTIARLEVFPHAILPIPRGFERTSWVQLERCRSLIGPEPESEAAIEVTPTPPESPLPPPESPLPPSPSPLAPPVMIAGPGGPFVAIRRDRDTGFTSLRVDERRLEDHGQSVGVLMRAICRYEPDQDEWRRCRGPSSAAPSGSFHAPPWTLAIRRGSSPRCRNRSGLFWVRWTETPTRRVRGVRYCAGGAGGIGACPVQRRGPRSATCGPHAGLRAVRRPRGGPPGADTAGHVRAVTALGSSPKPDPTRRPSTAGSPFSVNRSACVVAIAMPFGMPGLMTGLLGVAGALGTVPERVTLCL